ncbi:hypothetical protein BC828DRAFT_410035 [Blastocladiella britannica]|nr:hypothetical protein BC828DRAFT_410035 [Blastocladiella britannica]
MLVDAKPSPLIDAAAGNNRTVMVAGDVASMNGPLTSTGTCSGSDFGLVRVPTRASSDAGNGESATPADVFAAAATLAARSDLVPEESVSGRSRSAVMFFFFADEVESPLPVVASLPRDDEHHVAIEILQVDGEDVQMVPEGEKQQQS